MNRATTNLCGPLPSEQDICTRVSKYTDLSIDIWPPVIIEAGRKSDGDKAR